MTARRIATAYTLTSPDPLYLDLQSGSSLDQNPSLSWSYNSSDVISCHVYNMNQHCGNLDSVIISFSRSLDDTSIVSSEYHGFTIQPSYHPLLDMPV